MTTISTVEETPRVYTLRLTPRELLNPIRQSPIRQSPRDTESIRLTPRSSNIPEYVLDQNSISNRVFLALYGFEQDVIVDRGDRYNTEGIPVYQYSNPGYTYNEFLNLREFDDVFTGEG